MTEQPTNTKEVLNLHQKLARITGELGAIKKGGTNREQGYAFIEYAAVAGELRGLFAKYGVVIVPYMQRAAKQQRDHFTTAKGARGTTALIDFTFVVVNADKPDDKFSVTWTGEATDYGDKATNKAATSALKYYLMRQFNISEQGEDPDAESPTRPKTATEPAKAPNVPPATPQPQSVQGNEQRTPAQFRKLFALFTEAGYTDREERLQYLSWTSGRTIESSNDLTKAEAAKAIDALEHDIKEAKKEAA